MAVYGARLGMSDGTTTIEFLPPDTGEAGIFLEEWRPGASVPKGGGVWQDNVWVEGRRPTTMTLGNVIETYTLNVVALSPDALYRLTAKIRNLADKARQYHLSRHKTEPVWIIARSPCETEIRYMLVLNAEASEDSDPYNEIENKSIMRTMQDWVLTVEVEPAARDYPPGQSSCLEIAVDHSSRFPAYVEYDAVGDNINCGSDVGIDDLPDSLVTTGNFTWEMWVRFDDADVPTATTAYFVSKDATGIAGWYLGITTAGAVGFWGYVGFGPVGQSNSGLDDIPTDNDWHHLAMTWSDAWVGANRYPKLWLDGTEMTYTATGVAGAIGTYNTDAALNLYIGNDGATAASMPMDVGWCRLSNAVLYTIPFTPPPRCTLPTVVVPPCLGQWIGVENSGATIDNQETTAARDGTQTGLLFWTDCTQHAGNVDYSTGVIDPRCTDDVFVTSGWLNTIVTQMWRFSAPLYVDISPPATPVTLMTPAVGDMFYVGFEDLSGQLPWGLVFNITTALANVTAGQWEYWSGAWLPVDQVRDNTADATGIPFTNLGVNAVYLVGVLTPTPTTVNGVTAFWFRYRITGIGGGAGVAAVQGSPPVYAINKNYFEVQAEDVGGDIRAYLGLDLVCDSESDPSSFMDCTSLTLGLRDVARGANFINQLPAGDHNWPTGYSIVLGANTAYTNSPAGNWGLTRAADYSVVGADAAAARVTITLDETISLEYTGEYLIYMDMWTHNLGGGGAYNVETAVRVRNGSGGEWITTESYFFAGAGATFLSHSIKLGALFLGFEEGETADSITIEIQIGHDGVGVTPHIYVNRVVLMPTDEWAGEFISVNEAATMTAGELLNIESTAYAKRLCTALVFNPSGYVIRRFRCIVPSTFIFVEPDTRQRIWFYTRTYTTYGLIPDPGTSWRVQARKVQRYHSMRGDR